MKLNDLLSLLLTTEQGSRFGMAIASLFAVCAFLSFAMLLGSWWTDIRLPAWTGAATTTTQDFSSPLNELTQAIPRAHLFGYRSQMTSYMPITSSQLRLTGIIQQGAEGEENVFSKAIISVQGGIGKVYQVGDVLPDGVKLTGMEVDAVILDNNGHSERLPLQRARLGRN